jgi:outer membrane protein TolC
MATLRAALPAALALLASSPLAEEAQPATLSLDEALRLLDDRSLALAQARGRIEEAAGASRQALSAALPTVQVGGSYTRNSDAARAPIGQLLARQNPGAPAPPDLLIQPLEAFSASGAVRVPLVAPSAWADVSAARAAERGTEASADAVRVQLRAALVQSAWAASAGEEIASATLRAVASADEQARSAERAVAAGTGVPLAVLQARTEAVKRRSDLARARADLERARLASGVLLGRAEPVRIALPAAASPAVPDAGALIEEALSRRAEIRAADAQVAAAERQRESARLRWLPQLSTTASAFAQDVPFPTGKTDGWRLTLDLGWTLYDGGLRDGRARQASGAIAAARAAAEAERVAIAQEVQDGARDVALALERLHLAEEQARLAGDAAATARRGFAGGVASSLDVLDANDRLYQSDVGLADARARLGIALAALDRAAGRS